jgi:DNA-binding MarR family transcriptional regulator
LANHYNPSYYDFNKHNILKENINQYEIQILKTIRSKSKTENKISKEVKLNTSIVSELITNLTEKGFVTSVKRRRLFFFYSQYFSTTLEGLMALEEIKKNQDRNNNNTSWSQVVALMGRYRIYE